MSSIVCDILVVGGGVMGNSIAYHVARQGGRVLVVERSEIAAAPAASWASAGGVRRQGRHPAEARLASEAIERWPMLEQELDSDLHYRQSGNLRLAESDAEAQELAAFVLRQHACGFSDVRLVDRKEALELAPGLSERVVAGSYSPGDGQADPALTTRAFAAAAQRAGALYWTGTAVTTLLAQGARVVGARTGNGEVRAAQVVLVAGAWSDEIAATIGLRLPIRTLALQMLLSDPAASVSPQPVLSAVGRVLSLKQLDSGAFLLGGGWPGDPTPDRRTFTLRPESVRGNWTTACELLPAVGQQQIERSWCGLEAQSFDDLPFIGSLATWDGLTLALGFSGHGFALSPAVGRCLADQLADRPAPELDSLSPNRIAGFPLEQVEAFLRQNP